VNDDLTNSAYLAQLLSLLDSHFSEEELRTLCFQLQVAYETLPAQGKKNKVRELIEYMVRYQRVSELVTLLESERPFVNWQGNVTFDQEAPEFVQLRFPSRPFAALITTNGPQAGTWIFLTEQSRRIVFGRQAEVSIRDRSLSKNHFAIVVTLAENAAQQKREYQVGVLDLHSSNGTFVNGVNANGLMPLENGAIIQAGGSSFVFMDLPTNY
jgi:hypothetical protein